jgi:hypothetical protein
VGDEKMTPEEFAAAMEQVFWDLAYDIEAAHWEADRLLCKMLRELGYDEGVDVFEEVKKFYS